MQLSARPYPQRNWALTAVVGEPAHVVQAITKDVQRSPRALFIHT